MSDEQIVNNYELLKSYSLNKDDLINRLMFIVNERLDDAQKYKNQFNNNSMQPALYQTLCEIKHKIGKKLEIIQILIFDLIDFSN